jgi:hypothetical protein
MQNRTYLRKSMRCQLFRLAVAARIKLPTLSQNHLALLMQSPNQKDRAMRPTEPKAAGVLLIALAASALVESAAVADAPKDILSTTRAALAGTNLTPYDIGSRYGQALGASETCPGGKITEKATVLPSIYTGAKLDQFTDQQKKIYDAWIRAKHCAEDDTQNLCKVIVEESCATAVSEIGPSGTALPGLFEMTRP